MKPSIKVIYYITKVNGLIPFEINLQKSIAQKTKISFCYFLLFGAFIQGFSVISLHYIYLSLQSLPYEGARLFVIKGELAFAVLKSLISYTFTLLYHNDFVILIKKAISFRKLLAEVTPFEDFYDKTLIREYNTRCVALFIQVVILLSALFFLEYNANNLVVNLSWTQTIYSNIRWLIISTIFIYGGLTISSRFLRLLNNRLESFILSYFNGQDLDRSVSLPEIAGLHLEQFGIFFRKFSTFTNKLLHIFGFQIMLTIFASAESILTTVKKL